MCFMFVYFLSCDILDILYVNAAHENLFSLNLIYFQWHTSGISFAPSDRKGFMINAR